MYAQYFTKTAHERNMAGDNIVIVGLCKGYNRTDRAPLIMPVQTFELSISPPNIQHS